MNVATEHGQHLAKKACQEAKYCGVWANLDCLCCITFGYVTLSGGWELPVLLSRSYLQKVKKYGRKEGCGPSLEARAYRCQACPLGDRILYM